MPTAENRTCSPVGSVGFPSAFSPSFTSIASVLATFVSLSFTSIASVLATVVFVLATFVVVRSVVTISTFVSGVGGVSTVLSFGFSSIELAVFFFSVDTDVSIFVSDAISFLSATISSVLYLLEAASFFSVDAAFLVAFFLVVFFLVLVLAVVLGVHSPSL